MVNTPKKEDVVSIQYGDESGNLYRFAKQRFIYSPIVEHDDDDDDDLNDDPVKRDINEKTFDEILEEAFCLYENGEQEYQNRLMGSVYIYLYSREQNYSARIDQNASIYAPFLSKMKEFREIR